MSKSPILAIDDIEQNQANKHITHNDAVAALEAAMNDILPLEDIGAGPVNLTEKQATRHQAYRLSGASGDFDMVMPAEINTNNAKRVFSVRNETDHTVTVKVASGSGATVELSAGGSALLLQSYQDILVLALGADASFTALTDTPNNYTEAGGLFVRVKEDESGLEFSEGDSSYPPLEGNAGKVLTVNAEENNVEWGEGGGGSADYPSFEGNAGKVLVVNQEEDGVEWADASFTGATVASSFSFAGTPLSSQMVADIIFPSALAFFTDFEGSLAKMRTPPDGDDVVFDIEHNGESVATLTFADGSDTGVFAMEDPLIVEPGDSLTFIAPEDLYDCADLSVVIVGSF